MRQVLCAVAHVHTKFNFLSLLAVDRILPTASQHKRMTYTNCYIFRVVPPDDEQ